MEGFFGILLGFFRIFGDLLQDSFQNGILWTRFLGFEGILADSLRFLKDFSGFFGILLILGFYRIDIEQDRNNPEDSFRILLTRSGGGVIKRRCHDNQQLTIPITFEKPLATLEDPERSCGILY